MNIVQWDPFKEFDLFFDGMRDRNDTISGEIGRPKHDGFWSPAADILEHSDTYEVIVEAPSVDPGEMSITVEDGVLMISGDRKALSIGRDDRVHRKERLTGKFSRRFRLPKNADESKIEASSKQGVINIILGKKTKSLARVVDIESV